MKSARLACIALAAAALGSAGVRAQEWPSHPLTLVVPFAAGGSSDAIARIVADFA